MVSSGGVEGCVTVTRILVNQGRPMYNIDARSLQVGVGVGLCVCLCADVCCVVCLCVCMADVVPLLVFFANWFNG